MKLINTTDIPNETIREMVRISKPQGITNFDIQIKNCQVYDWTVGRAYTRGSGYHNNWNWFINVRVPLGSPKYTQHPDKEDKFGCKKMIREFLPISYPRIRKAHKAYLSYLVLDKEEEVLAVIAHELRHLWQKKHPKGWRVWGAKGKFSERDADAYSIRALREFRRGRIRNVDIEHFEYMERFIQKEIDSTSVDTINSGLISIWQSDGSIVLERPFEVAATGKTA